jgi:hypothetical protein
MAATRARREAGMAGQYPDRIKTLPLYDGRFEVDTDEIELWFESGA